MEKKQVQADEERNVTWHISPEYLTHAAYIVATQFLAEKADMWTERTQFNIDADFLMKEHCPVAYAYYFQFAQNDTTVLPTGTTDIILEIIRRTNPTFLGGKHSGIILPN